MKAFTRTVRIVWSFCLYAGAVHATWSLPSQVSATDGSVCDPQVSMDSDGSAVVVWLNFGETNWSIQSATKLRDGCWQNPSTVLSAQDRIPHDPRIAVDPSGTAVVLWVEEDSVIHASERFYGGDWKEDPDTISLSETPAAFSQFQRVAIDADGNATAVWKMFNGEHFVILASARPCGYIWQTAPDTLSEPGRDGNSPEVAVDSNGNAVAVWQQYDGVNLLINASQKPFGGSWQPSASVISRSLCNSVNPRVAADADGNVTVVWECCLDGTWGIQAAQKPLNGIWTDPETISGSLSASSLNQEAQLAIDPSGNVMAVWTASSKEGSSIHFSLKPKGGSWQEVPDALSLVGHGVFCPKIGVDSGGSATVVWLDSDGYRVGVEALVKPSGGSWQSSPDSLSSAYKNAGSLQLAVSADGTAAAVWREIDRSAPDESCTSAVVSSFLQ